MAKVTATEAVATVKVVAVMALAGMVLPTVGKMAENVAMAMKASEHSAEATEASMGLERVEELVEASGGWMGLEPVEATVDGAVD